jgi:hypothetical protein
MRAGGRTQIVRIAVEQVGDGAVDQFIGSEGGRSKPRFQLV